MLFTGRLLSKWFLDDIVPGDTEELDLFGYEAQWHRRVIAGPAITKYKARWAPLGQCLSGSSPPAMGTLGVLAALPIPGLQRDLCNEGRHPREPVSLVWEPLLSGRHRV